MGSSSAFSLCSQTNISNPKFLSYNRHCKFQSPSLNLPQKSETVILTFKFLTSSRSSKFLTRSSYHVNPYPPLSKCPNFNFSSLTQKNLYQILSEKVVGFIIGSFIFAGCFNIKAAIALPAPTSSSAANFEENIDTQEAKREDEEMYEKLLEKDPRNVEALKVMLYEKMRRGKTKEALKYVQSLIGVEPEEVEWRLLLALCYEIMGQLSTAKRLFKEILERRPLLLRALHGLAMVMHKNHEDPALFEMLNKALEIAHREKRVTEERNIRILIAQMNVVQGHLEEGLKKLQDLVKEDPRDFRPYLCQGIVYSLLGKEKEAAKQFETYQALVPEEFPQRGFLNDVILTAKTNPGEQFQKQFDAAFSYRK